MRRLTHAGLWCILTLALCPCTAGSTGFADASLEAAVRQALGRGEGSLTPTELSSLTQLSARDLQIRRTNSSPRTLRPYRKDRAKRFHNYRSL